jgi:hypothetical protein
VNEKKRIADRRAGFACLDPGDLSTQGLSIDRRVSKVSPDQPNPQRIPHPAIAHAANTTSRTVPIERQILANGSDVGPKSPDRPASNSRSSSVTITNWKDATSATSSPSIADHGTPISSGSEGRRGSPANATSRDPFAQGAACGRQKIGRGPPGPRDDRVRKHDEEHHRAPDHDGSKSRLPMSATSPRYAAASS